ncbi:FHA domain-containing protein, partial [candidate division CSSED10-310 bacterium]
IIKPSQIEPIRDVFVRHYPEIRTYLGQMKTPGYLLYALTSAVGSVEHAILPFAENDCCDIILGRHRKCPFRLSNDRTISLRHLLVRAYRKSDGEPRIKITDLNTLTGFQDEMGKTVRGLMSDGHIFFTVGEYYVMAILQNGQNWPKEGSEAWDLLPERKIIDELEFQGDTDGGVHDKDSHWHSTSSSENEISYTSRISSHHSWQDLASNDEEVIGFLSLERAPYRLTLQLSFNILTSGILIGRYKRCEISAYNLTLSDRISRVHLCLLLDETGLWAIDTASTNGSTYQGRDIQSIRLKNQDKLMLASELSLQWRSKII